MDNQHDVLARIEGKLDKMDEKLSKHLERIAVVEEHSKTNRGALAVGFTTLLTIIGWLVMKIGIIVKP